MSKAAAPPPLSVTVAVLTYRRPDDLAAALPLLVEQLSGIDENGELLVVDNDPEASARELVAGFAGVGVRYAHEPRPGIAAARNRALDESANSDVLVFIDDDERPVDSWLEHLLVTFRDTSPVGVVGPVVSEFTGQADPWIRAGRFFDRRQLPSGTEVDVAATNNLLLDIAELRRLGVRFDERFGLSGGSDTMFTRQIVRLGGRLIWCADAVVVDVVPQQRLTRRWVLRRAFRSGNTWARTSMALSVGTWEPLRQRVGLVASGGIRLAGGLGLALVGTLLRSSSQQARGIRTAARGAGMLTGAIGFVLTEYRRSPARVSDPDRRVPRARSWFPASRG